MSDLVFTCHHCGKKLVIDEVGVAKRVDCPDCEAQNTVPQPEMEFGCPRCGTRYSAPDNLRGELIECPHCGSSFVIGKATDGDERCPFGKCPDCEASLPKDASFCVKCGTNLKARLRPSLPNKPAGEPAHNVNRSAEAAPNPVFALLSRPVRKAPGFAERCMPALKAIALLCCAVAAAVVARHYFNRGVGSTGTTPPVVAVPAQQAAGLTTAAVEVAAIPETAIQPEPDTTMPGTVTAVISNLERLKSNAADLEAGKELVSFIGGIDETNGARNIVAGLKTIYSLREIGLGREDAGLAACAHVARHYGDTEFVNIVGRDRFQEACPQCGGKGTTVSSCAECAGTGQCRDCAGRGSRQSVRSSSLSGAAPIQRGGVRRIQDVQSRETVTTVCSACQGGGRCPVCRGTRQQAGGCRHCQNKGVVVSRTKVKLLYDSAISTTIQCLRLFGQSGQELRLGGGMATFGKQESVGVETGPAIVATTTAQPAPASVQRVDPAQINYASRLVTFVDETFVPLTEVGPDVSGMIEFMNECSMKTGAETDIARVSIRLCQRLREVRRERDRRVEQYKSTEQKSYTGLAPSRSFSSRCNHNRGYYYGGYCDACRMKLAQQEADQQRAAQQSADRKNFYLNAIVSNWRTYEAAERSACERELQTIRGMERELRSALASTAASTDAAPQP